jgi:hypothetical protein
MAPDVARDASITAGGSKTALASYLVGSLAGTNFLIPESTDANGVEISGSLTTTLGVDDIVDQAGNSVSLGGSSLSPGATSAANSSMAASILVNAAPTAVATFFDSSGTPVATPVGQLPPRVTPVPTLTIKFTNPATFLPQAVPFLVTPPGSPPSPPFGAGTLTIDDFRLTKNGVIIPDLASKGVVITTPTTGPNAYADFQLAGLENVTNEPGAYTLTFSDLGIGESRIVSWVKDYVTPSELRATLTPSPVISNGITDGQVGSITVRFTDAAGAIDGVYQPYVPASGTTPASGDLPVPITGITTGTIPDATQFALYRDGVLIAGSATNPWASPVTVSGFDNTYIITGLASLTTMDGAYELRLLDGSNGIRSLGDADTTPNGSTLKAPVSYMWQKSTPPTVIATSNKASLANGETATITFTLSKATINFVSTDVVATNGTISNFLQTANPLVYTATFTPNTSTIIPGTVTVPAGAFTDALGNNNASGSVTLALNTPAPTVTITSNKALVNLTETALITFTLSAASTTFGVGDIVVSGGTLSSFTGSGTAYTAVFTPNAGATLGLVSVPAAQFTDADGNGNLAGSIAGAIIIDSVAPTIAISASVTTLGPGQTATITFTLSEASATPSTFTAADVIVSGGTLTGFASISPTVYTATLTTAAGFSSAVVAVPAGAFADAAGNANTAGGMLTVSKPLTAAVSLSPASGASPRVTPVDSATITFSENVDNVDLSDFDFLVNGTVVPWVGSTAVLSSQGTGSTYTITGLTSLTSSRATYELRLKVSNISSYTGGQLIGPVSSAWTYNGATRIPAGGVTAPIPPASGFFKKGDVMNFSVRFSDPVFMPNPAGVTLPFVIGTSDIDAIYVGGTGTTELRFRYTVQTGDEDRDGILLSGTIIAPAGAIKDATGADAELTYSPPDTSMVFVDAVNPTLTTVARPANGTYIAGSTLTFTATFSEPMLVSGAPRIAMTIGNVTRYAGYAAGAETRELVFEYLIQPGDSDLNGIVVASTISLNGGSITDLAGNTGGLTFSPLITTGMIVDAAPPVVTRFSVPASTANGAYRAGQQIPIEATLSKPVVVGSEISVTLDTGAPPVRLRALSTGTLLQGIYVIAAGENSIDLTVTAFVEVSVADAVGNQLGSTIVPTGANNIAGARAIVIDTISPAIPLITRVADNVMPVTSDVASGASTNDNTPTISGTAEPFAVITLRAGSSVMGTVTADAGGVWSITPTPLVDGAYALTATVADAAGNISPSSSAYLLSIDTRAPAAPTFGSVSGKVLSGTAEAMATVTILRSGTAIGTANAGQDGGWICDLPLQDGDYTLTATATDTAGNVSPPTQPRNVTIDTEAPLAPVIAVVVDNVDLLRGSIASGGLTNDSTPTVSGTAEPRSVVTLWSGVTKLGTTATNDRGDWSITPNPLASGTYLLVATATDANGNTSPASAVHAITIDSVAPQSPTITAAVDDVLQYTGLVASGGATNDVLPTFNGTAEKGSLVSLMNGASVIGTTTADANGQWSITPATELSANGLWTLSATATDPAGNVSDMSVPFRLTIDTVSPSAPVITAIESDVPPNFGTLASGSQTNDRTLKVTGKTEPNGRVTFWINHGTSRAMNIVARATPSGDWAVTTPALTDGPHSFSAIVRDAASNRSGLSAASSATVDTIAPAATSVMAMLASGTYGIGQIVDIQVQFSENVQVGGSPTLGLMTSPARVATFVMTSGNTVTFRYVVTAGDVAKNLDYASSTPIVLNGGWIRDPAGNDARLDLPSPGTPGSLSGSKTIAIDALIKVLGGGLSTTLAEAPSFTTRRPTMTITFNTPVTGVDLSAIKLFYEGRSVSLTGATVSGSGTTFTLSIPGVATSLKGAYRLRIGGPGTSITAGGATMNTPTNLYWRRV